MDRSPIRLDVMLTQRYMKHVLVLLLLITILLSFFSGTQNNKSIKVGHANITHQLTQNNKSIKVGHTNMTHHTQRNISKKTEPKVILLWNSFWGKNAWVVGLGSEPFKRLKCPIDNCVISDERRDVNKSDAILFHATSLNKVKPKWRKANQRWVFWTLECPAFWGRNYEYMNWNGLFNWTMTYRLDSDIPILYGKIWKRQKPHNRTTTHLMEIARSKNKTIAWFVSNCNTQSNRMKYVKELQKYIPVDIYGRCGTMDCWGKQFQFQIERGDPDCLGMLHKTYKFYLAFENSYCQDYVTEKLFKVIPYDIVPIVRGGARYTDYTKGKLYISADYFKSPKDLAMHLHFLNLNDSEYIKYLKEKDIYESATYFNPSTMPAWCQLCAKLNDPHEPQKVYHNIHQWYNHCHPPPKWR